MGKMVIINDLMQKNYKYELIAKTGKEFNSQFKPELTPKEMLSLGVFGGKYMTDCQNEFPKDWFKEAKLCHEFHNPKLNYFNVNASKPLSYWQKKVGFTQKIREVGFSGIVDIIWAVEFLKKMFAK